MDRAIVLLTIRCGFESRYERQQVSFMRHLLFFPMKNSTLPDLMIWSSPYMCRNLYILNSQSFHYLPINFGLHLPETCEDCSPGCHVNSIPMSRIIFYVPKPRGRHLIHSPFEHCIVIKCP